MIFITLAVAAMIATWPRQPTYFGFISEGRMLGLVGYLFAVLTIQIANAFKTSIEEFAPQTQLEAKRANEQIKATATLINAAAAGTLTVFVLARIASVEEPQYIHLVLALGFALWLHSKSRTVLGLLKDESLPASIVEDRA